MRSTGRSSLAVQPSPGSVRTTLPSSFQRRRLSWGFGPLQHRRFGRLRPPGFHPRVPPAYGFAPSWRAFFRPILSGPISSRKRSWGSPFRGFPSCGGLQIRHLQLPLLSFPRWPPRPLLAPRVIRGKGLGRLQGLALRPSPFARRGGLGRVEAVPLLGFVLLRGVPAVGDGRSPSTSRALFASGLPRG